MKYSARLVLFVVAVLLGSIEMRAQESSAVRPRVVTVAPQEQQQQAVPTTKLPPANPATIGPTLPVIEADPQKKISEPITHLTPSVIQNRISEAQRMFKSRPKPTAFVPSIEFVTVAALDRETARTHFISVSKETFLTKGAEVNTVTSEGMQINLRIIRANGVNTAM